jgi:hypothetical protein
MVSQPTDPTTQAPARTEPPTVLFAARLSRPHLRLPARWEPHGERPEGASHCLWTPLLAGPCARLGLDRRATHCAVGGVERLCDALSTQRLSGLHHRSGSERPSERPLVSMSFCLRRFRRGARRNRPMRRKVPPTHCPRNLLDTFRGGNLALGVRRALLPSGPMSGAT